MAPGQSTFEAFSAAHPNPGGVGGGWQNLSRSMQAAWADAERGAIAHHVHTQTWQARRDKLLALHEQTGDQFWLDFACTIERESNT